MFHVILFCGPCLRVHCNISHIFYFAFTSSSVHVPFCSISVALPPLNTRLTVQCFLYTYLFFNCSYSKLVCIFLFILVWLRLASSLLLCKDATQGTCLRFEPETDLAAGRRANLLATPHPGSKLHHSPLYAATLYLLFLFIILPLIVYWVTYKAKIRTRKNFLK